jgi:methionyl-tRNA synthetase
MSISSEGNGYLQESKFWKLYKEDKPSCAIVIRTAAGLVQILAQLLEPFMPSFSREVFKQLDLAPQFSLSDERGEVLLTSRPWEILPPSHKIGTPQPLFNELKDEEVQQYREKFAGSQADRRARDVEAAADKLKKTKLSDAKKQKASKGAGASKTQPAAEREVTMARLDIRVGKILKAEKHPKADSLYVEEIDVGGGEIRTVVSGLVKYIPLEEMQNRMVCVLCNLKPAKMREIMSQAMVLAASSSDGSKVELVEPPASAKIGERVTFSGFEGEPDEVLNPKKKVWETLVVDLRTNEDLVACYKDLPFTTSAGECKVSSISNGTIR